MELVLNGLHKPTIRALRVVRTQHGRDKRLMCPPGRLLSVCSPLPASAGSTPLWPRAGRREGVRHFHSERDKKREERGVERAGASKSEREGGKERERENKRLNAAAILAAGLTTNKMTEGWYKNPGTPSSINALAVEADWTTLTGDAIKMDIPPTDHPHPPYYHPLLLYPPPPLFK